MKVVSNMEVALSLALQLFFELSCPAMPGRRYDTAALAAVKLERLRGRFAAEGIIIVEEVLKDILPSAARIAAAAAVLSPYGDEVLWDSVGDFCPSGFTRRALDDDEAAAQTAMVIGPQIFSQSAWAMAQNLEALRLKKYEAEAAQVSPARPECDLGTWLGEKD